MRAGVLQPTTTISRGLSLWLDEKWGHDIALLRAWWSIGPQTRRSRQTSHKLTES